MSYTIDRIGGAEWQLLREIRLPALLDAPYALGSTRKDVYFLFHYPETM